MGTADFEQLYQTYYMQVYSFLMAMSKDKELAEELTQKTFVKVLTAKKPYEGKSSEWTWLCAIAKNLFLEELRRQKNMRGDSGWAEDVTALPQADKKGLEEALIEEDSAFEVHQVLHRLEEPYKEVFGLRVFGELSFQKIGRLFGKTESWARVTYHRARLKIQEGMEK